MLYNHSFEEFLREVHGLEYHGLDDDMPDEFDRWLANLPIDKVIALADEFGQRLLEKVGKVKVSKLKEILAKE